MGEQRRSEIYGEEEGSSDLGHMRVAHRHQLCEEPECLVRANSVSSTPKNAPQQGTCTGCNCASPPKVHWRSASLAANISILVHLDAQVKSGIGERRL